MSGHLRDGGHYYVVLYGTTICFSNLTINIYLNNSGGAPREISYNRFAIWCN